MRASGSTAPGRCFRTRLARIPRRRWKFEAIREGWACIILISGHASPKRAAGPTRNR